MRAITLVPHQPGSARQDDIPEPDPAEGRVLVETVAVGVCGTDAEIAAGSYGWAPPGRDRLVLGHESLGRVVDPGGATGFAPGDLVVGIVRQADPVPCDSCAVGEWDMCRNGQYTEHGIKALDGFMRDRWRIPGPQLLKIDPSLGLLGVLLEPTSVVAKAWEVLTAVGTRAFWEPRTALVTGAGPIGLLAAMIGRQRGLEVHVLDRVTDGPKPQLVADLGATYHSGPLADVPVRPDVIIECTGVGQLIADAMGKVAPGGVLALTGVGAGGKKVTVPLADIATEVVLDNNGIVGSVNANRRHYFKASQSLAAADREWLGRLVTRREPPERFEQALERDPDDVKVVVQFADA